MDPGAHEGAQWAPARCVNHVLQAKGLYDSVGSFIDDICNGASNHDQNLMAVERLLSALAAHLFRLGAGKFEIGALQLSAFGYVVKDGKLVADPEQVTAITRLVPPQNRS